MERVLTHMGRWARQAGLSQYGVGREQVRMGIVDGTSMGKQLTSCLLMAGRIHTVMGMQQMEKKGKELPTTLALLRRAKEQYGRGFADVIVGDGLYACTSFFRCCQEIGACGVVKTDEETLAIREDIDGMCDAPVRLPDVECIRGFDSERCCTYTVYRVRSLEWQDTGIMLQGIRVDETYHSGPYKGQTHRFYILVSQELELDAMVLREIAHGRWIIENNGFKGMNEQVHSKHLFSHDPHTALILSYLQVIGYMLIELYKVWMTQCQEHMRGMWDHGSCSYQFLRDQLVCSLEGSAGWNSS